MASSKIKNIYHGLIFVGLLGLPLDVTSKENSSLPLHVNKTLSTKELAWPILDYDPITLDGEIDRVVFSCHKCGSSLTGQLFGKACIMVSKKAIPCSFIFL